MKKYRYGLAVTSQFYFCGIPFRLDTTPKCSLNCLYCFAKTRGGRKTSTKLIIDVNSFVNKLRRALDDKVHDLDIVGEMLAHKLPLHFGGISDPFSNYRTARQSIKLLKLLNSFNYPIIISTKNTEFLIRDDVIEILKSMKHLAVQISISTSNSKLTRRIEPFAPSPGHRIKCIKLLSKENIYVIVRLQPLIFPFINDIKKELIPKIAEAKCRHVIVEYLKLPVEKNISMINNFCRSLSWDSYDFYKKNGASLVGREWILPGEFKWRHLKSIIKAIHNCGMTYGSADYHLNHMGDTECCCGFNNRKGFSSWFKGNYANLIREASTGEITFDAITKYWLPKKSIAMYLNSNCRLPSNNTMENLLKDKWNRPGTVNAPDSFLGIYWTGEVDKQGNCIYYKKEIR